MKIRLKLILAFVFVILVTAALYGLSSYYSLAQTIRSFEGRYRTGYHWLIVRQVDEVLTRILEDAGRIPAAALLRALAEQGATADPATSELLDPSLLRNAAYTTDEGRTRILAPPLPAGALEDADLSLKIVPSENPRRSWLRVARTFPDPRNGKRGRAFLFLDLDRIFRDRILTGPLAQTRLSLRDPSGRLLYSTSESIPGGKEIHRMLEDLEKAQARSADMTRDPYYTSEIVGPGGKTLAVGALIPVLQTPLFMEAETIEPNPLISSLSFNLLMIGLAIIWVSVWIAMVMGYRIMKPVEDLSRGAERIASGEYDFRIRERGRDEIGVLAQKFNEMARAVENRSLELERSNLELKEQDQQKTRFLDIVAHDLRTPLTSIKAYADLLLRFPDEDEKTKKEFLEVILLESERMASLINDYLDLTKLENGTLPYHFQETNLTEMIRDFERTKQAECLIKKIRIQALIPRPLPPVEADPARMRQVFANLLSNAVRYSPPGGRVTITAERVLEQESEWIQVSVRDQGPGIPEAFRELVFDKFRQLDTQPLHSKGGAGLGLPISREIVRKHGGTIWAEGEPGTGALFAFRIPVRPPKAEKEPAMDPLPVEDGSVP